MKWFRKLLIVMVTFSLFMTSVPINSAMSKEIQKSEQQIKVMENDVQLPNKLVASDKKVELDVNQVQNIAINAVIADGTEEDVTELARWEVEDSEIATVQEGEIKGIQEGNTSIKVTYEGDEIVIPVEVKSPAIELKEPKVTIQDSEILLAWEMNKLIESYTIKRKTGIEDYVEIATQILSGEFADKDYIDGEKYTYLVVGIDKNGEEYSSDEVDVQTQVRQANLEVSDQEISLLPGESKKVKVSSILADGDKQDVTRSVNWDVSDHNILEVIDGDLYAIEPGSAVVSAHYHNQKVEINVVVRELSTITDTEYTVTLNKGESYQINNIASSSKSIDVEHTNEAKFDYAVYKKDGTPDEMEISSGRSRVSIAAGGRAVITAISDSPVTLKAKKAFFTGEKSSNPAVLKTTLHQGESYQFTNKGNINIRVEKEYLLNGMFDYAVYNAAGGGVNQGLSEASNSIDVPAGGKIIFTGVTESVSVVGSYYDFFEGNESQQPALLKVFLNNGESYRFTNHAKTSTNIQTDAVRFDNRKFDFISYRQDGISQSKDVQVSGKHHRLDVPVGGFTILTNVSKDPIMFGGYHELLTGEASSQQALWRIEVNKGESYKISNTSNKDQTLVNNTYVEGRMFDYVRKNANGSIRSSKTNYSAFIVLSYIDNEISIPAGSHIIVSGTGENPVTIGGEEAFFNAEQINDPALVRVTVGKGESYRFTNTSTSNIDFVSDASVADKRKYDWAVYYQDKKGKRLGKETIKDIVEVPPGGEMVVTGTSDAPVTIGAPFGFADVKGTINPALLKRTVSPGENVTLSNFSNFESEVETDASSGGIFDYKTYNESGALVTHNVNSTTRSIKVPQKGRLDVTVSGGSPVNFYGYFDHFQSQDLPSSPFTNITINSSQDIAQENVNAAYFKFTTSNAGVYRIFTSNVKGTGAEYDTILQLYADEQLTSLLSENDNVAGGPYGELFSKIEHSLSGGTTYYVKVSSGKSSPSLNARLTVEQVDADSTREGAIPAEWDQIYTDRLSSRYDVDYFKLTAEEIAFMNLYVTSNMLILEDQGGNTLKTFLPGQEDKLFITESAGIYYAKVVWNQAVTKNTSLLLVPDEGDRYDVGLHSPKRVSQNTVIDTTPGFKKSVTVQWRFSKPHQEVSIQVLRGTIVVYEETRLNQPANTFLTFTWDGKYNKGNPGQLAETGHYVVKVVAKDAPDYDINILVRVMNTHASKVHNVQELINANIGESPETIKALQRALKDMKFYDYVGEPDGIYDEDLLMSIIAFEMVINRSAMVGPQGGQPLMEQGKINAELLDYVVRSHRLNRDKLGEFAEFLFNGDVIIYDTATLIPAFRMVKTGGKIVIKAGKTIGDLFECNCFTAGTKVLTDEGEKNIEDIKVGDMVLSKNDETGEQAYKAVTHLYRNEKDIIYELSVGDQVIETTDNHPFWVEGKGWVVAANLQVWDKLQQSNGNTLTIDHIKIVKHDEKVKVYNFTVADFNTYFVSDLGIWVHNINGCLDPNVLRNVGDDILDKMEKVGGHTLEKHVSKTNEELINRANKEDVEAATSFTDKSTAIKSVQENLRRNADEIALWINESDTGRKIFEMDHAFPIGKGVLQDKKKIKYDLTYSRLVLVRDLSQEWGFKILTAFPVVK
ncbi:polymorphic toxin-type HINT domain-containing protein [Brevibacillus sp. 179-C9.3 HS]|uniref:polymorphic toxin-type HINT domain-containing protein n=1 Tax=unclassified Brevibacillus TaxID=2684853 RepID=UPI0039A16D32